jgi:hypothetical protein
VYVASARRIWHKCPTPGARNVRGCGQLDPHCTRRPSYELALDLRPTLGSSSDARIAPEVGKACADRRGMDRARTSAYIGSTGSPSFSPGAPSP